MRAIYDGLRVEMKRLEDVTKLSQEIDENFNGDNRPVPYYIAEFLTARIDLIELYPFLEFYQYFSLKHLDLDKSSLNVTHILKAKMTIYSTRIV